MCSVPVFVALALANIFEKMWFKVFPKNLKWSKGLPFSKSMDPCWMATSDQILWLWRHHLAFSLFYSGKGLVFLERS